MSVQLRCTVEQPEYVTGLAWYPYSKKWEAFATYPTKYEGEVCIATRKDNLIGIPRALFVGEAANDWTVEGEAIALNCTKPPRDEEQARVISESAKLLLSGQNHVIKATTGFGKTYVGVALACIIQRPVLVIVTKEDLLSEAQWKGAFKKFAGLTDDDIGLIQGDTCDYVGKKVVLAMVHSLVKDKYPAGLKTYFGMVIFDEVHRMGADTFMDACGMFPAKVRLGLSATPTRIDGKEFIFFAHIGPIMVSSSMVMTPLKVIFRKTKFKLPTVIRRVNGNTIRVPMPLEAGKLMGLYKAMAQDDDRNKEIIDFVYAAWKKNRRIIIFSELREVHLDRLHLMLVHRGIPAEDMGYYVGGMKAAEREKSKHKKIILATYAMASEGTDIPWLDTAVLATPRANIEQIVGRILREWDGKLDPVLFDLMDDCHNILSGYLSKRRVSYLKLKATLMYL